VKGDPREVVTDDQAPYYGVRLSERTLVPSPDAQLGETTFDKWLAQQQSRPRPATQCSKERPMEQPKVAVVHHGQAGALQAVAKEVAAGAEEMGAVVRIRRLPRHAAPGTGATEGLAASDDVNWADAVVLGSPSQYGTLAPPLRAYVEQLRRLEGERLSGIVWSGLVSADGVLHGGHEATLRTLFHALSQLGGVIVPAAGAQGTDLGTDMRTVARQTGRDVADVARRLIVGTATELVLAGSTDGRGES
jgi:NAD(P)H dehydrogenase (quinone)